MVKGIWYWYYRHWPLMFKGIYTIISIIVLWLIFNSPTFIAMLIMAGAICILILISHLMSWLGDQYLVRYDDGYRWIRGLPPRRKRRKTKP